MNEATTKPMILVVDDQPTNIQILAESLQPLYDVRIANNGLKALQIAQGSKQPDLILLDVMMPGMNGFEVCRILKSNQTTQHIPIIFVTAKNNPSDEEQGLNLGGIDYISKPFSIPVVKARVRNHIQLKQRADLLEELASIDPLTHLPNRRLFDNTLQDELKRAQREHTPLSVLMIDIDYFKNYNDHFGHGAGDICLQRVANAMQSGKSRPGDMVARFGGEEFIVILPNTDREGAKVTGERLRKQVETLQIPHLYSGAGPVVSISVGCATSDPIAKNNSEIALINAADAQLYKAKQRGRNRVE